MCNQKCCLKRLFSSYAYTNLYGFEIFVGCRTDNSQLINAPLKTDLQTSTRDNDFSARHGRYASYFDQTNHGTGSDRQPHRITKHSPFCYMKLGLRLLSHFDQGTDREPSSRDNRASKQVRLLVSPEPNQRGMVLLGLRPTVGVTWSNPQL